MAEALVTLLMIGGLFGFAAGCVEGARYLRKRREDVPDWAREGGLHLW